MGRGDFNSLAEEELGNRLGLSIIQCFIVTNQSVVHAHHSVTSDTGRLRKKFTYSNRLLMCANDNFQTKLPLVGVTSHEDFSSWLFI